MFEMSTLKFFKSESVTHTVNFGIGPAFSKSPGSTLFEGPGPGPSLLYKVCPVSFIIICFTHFYIYKKQF